MWPSAIRDRLTGAPMSQLYQMQALSASSRWTMRAPPAGAELHGHRRPAVGQAHRPGGTNFARSVAVSPSGKTVYVTRYADTYFATVAYNG